MSVSTGGVKLREPQIEIGEQFDEIEIHNPIDTHQHWRGAEHATKILPTAKTADGKLVRNLHNEHRADLMFDTVVPMTGKIYSAAVGMPNLIPEHIDTKEALLSYNSRVLALLEKEQIDNFTPWYKISFTKNLTPKIIEECYNTWLPVSVKFYPGGATTNAEWAMTEFDVDAQAGNLEMMEKLWIPFSLHSQTSLQHDEDGNITAWFVDRAEREFVDQVIPKIAEKYPKLKIIIEHISTKEAVEMVKKFPNVYGGVTPSHMFHTKHDLIGSGQMKPHNFITPVPNEPEDKKAIRELVLSRHPRVMFGTDSAPHSEDKKECAVCASGVFSSPIALQKIAEFYYSNADKIERKPWEEGLSYKQLVQKAMQEFTSDTAQEVYGPVPESSKKVVKLKRKDMKIPDRFFIAGDKIGDKDIWVVPMEAGSTISWTIDSIGGKVVQITNQWVEFQQAA